MTNSIFLMQLLRLYLQTERLYFTVIQNIAHKSFNVALVTLNNWKGQRHKHGYTNFTTSFRTSKGVSEIYVPKSNLMNGKGQFVFACVCFNKTHQQHFGVNFFGVKRALFISDNKCNYNFSAKYFIQLCQPYSNNL